MPDPGAEPHAAHLQQALLAAQVELGAALGRIVEGGCALSGLLQWLAAEYALAGAAAAALESIRPRLATSTAPWTQAQMAALREAGRAAADDVRRTSGMVAPPSVEVGQFRDYFETFAGRQPYQVLGAVAVQALATGGAASPAISALLAEPAIPHQATAYLTLRQAQAQEEALGWCWLWQSLPDIDARRALLEGVGRGVALHRAVCSAALHPGAESVDWLGYPAAAIKP